MLADPGRALQRGLGVLVAAAIGVPVWQDIRASHPDNRLRLIVSLGKAF